MAIVTAKSPGNVIASSDFNAIVNKIQNGTDSDIRLSGSTTSDIKLLELSRNCATTSEPLISASLSNVTDSQQIASFTNAGTGYNVLLTQNNTSAASVLRIDDNSTLNSGASVNITSDRTSSGVGITVTMSSTAGGIYVSQVGNGVPILVNSQATTAYSTFDFHGTRTSTTPGVRFYDDSPSTALAYKSTVLIQENNASNTTDLLYCVHELGNGKVAWFNQKAASATATEVQIDNAGSGYNLYLNSTNAAGKCLRVDSALTSDAGSPAVVDIRANSLTGGVALWVQSSSVLTPGYPGYPGLGVFSLWTTGNTAYCIIANNASTSTGGGIWISNAGNYNGLRVVQSHTTANWAIQSQAVYLGIVSEVSGATAVAGKFYCNGAGNNTGLVAQIDNVSATGTSLIVYNSGAGLGVYCASNGTGSPLLLTPQGTAPSTGLAAGCLYVNNSTKKLNIYSGTAWGEVGGGGTKEMFFPAETASTVGDFRVRANAGTSSWEFDFAIPQDFVSLVSVELIGWPTANITGGTYALYSDYGAVGQVYSTHDESAIGLSLNGTANQFLAISLAPVLTNIAAGDFCGVEIDHVAMTTTISFIGVRLRYN